MNRFFTLLKMESRLIMRDMNSIIFGILMPTGIAFLMGAICGSKPAFDGAGYTYIQESFASLITVGICATAFMGMPITIADYRNKKILKHYYVTPVKPALILMVHVIINVAISIVSTIAVALIMKIFFGYKMKGELASFILVYFLVMAAMYGLGMIIASLCRSTKSVDLVCSLVYFPMLFLSGATIPYSLNVLQKDKKADFENDILNRIKEEYPCQKNSR